MSILLGACSANRWRCLNVKAVQVQILLDIFVILPSSTRTWNESQTLTSNFAKLYCKVKREGQTKMSVYATTAATQDNCDVSTVAYIYDEELAKATESIPNVYNRSTIVHSLIDAYGLTSKLRIISSKPATTEDVLTFHSKTYLDFLFRDHVEGENTDEEDEFGLGYDCPLFTGMEKFAYILTGGTLTAVDALLNGSQLAINWCGGWHHAQRNLASGFCYVNDIVIGICKLLSKFERILYIDLDAHHGDGVENAFTVCRKVMTLSLHNYTLGYFPGTGNVTDVGVEPGRYYTVNVPLLNGICDKNYFMVFERVLNMVKPKFKAEAIVVQCGADCLAGDPLGCLNLTEICVGSCVRVIKEWGIPTLFLGGGGYNIQNSARCWAYLTSVICETEISCDIPEHEFFPQYGPGFDLHISPSMRKDDNDSAYISCLLERIQEHLEQIGSNNE